MVYKSKVHRKSGLIKVTHYVNPHEFWFKYVDAEDESMDNDIQQRIQRLGNVSQSHYNHLPLVGEIVIVRYSFGAANKFIRARVDFELKYGARSEFVLWAIDEGFPIQSRTKWITQLTSTDLQNENSHVFKATLNDVVPATVQFNFMEGKSETVKTSCWSEKAINQFEKISNAESLIFHYDCHAAKQHLYGSVEVVTFSGKRVNMSQVLKDLDEAVDATNFEKEYQTLLQRDYWIQPQENYKIKENFQGNMSLLQSDVEALNPKNISEINTVDKINDWDKRNQRLLTASNNDADSLCQKVKDCNLSEVPLNKRYEYHCSKLNTSQPCTSTTDNLSNVSTSSTVESPEDSFHSAALTLSPQVMANTYIPKFHFKKALQQESGFSTRHKERVLMHCSQGVSVTPIEDISESNFMDEILAKLKSLGKTDIRRIQAVAWPLLMRTKSLVVINAAKTGKTWSYLPAVCSLLMEAHSDESIEGSDGPVMIIICLDSSSVNLVRKHCRSLLSEQFSCEVYVQHETQDIQYKMLNGIDILITTLPCLLRLMKQPLRLFNKTRIRTIVFDEIDTMCDRFGERDIDAVYKAFLVDSKVQMVVTSKTWHKTLRKCCQRDDVLLCIGAYIEAAIYSKVEITVQTINEQDRYGQFLSYFKKRNYIDETTIIICSESQEVLTIERIFRSETYAVTFCHDKTDSIKINEINRQIKQNLTNQMGVLVCTDDVLGDLNIRNAQHIIHFSLPVNWTMFTKRFIASFDYYENLVQDRLSAGRPTSLVFVGGGSDDSMPRLIEFMKERCFAEVPKNVLKLAEERRIEREKKRLTEYRPFCGNILLFGECHNQYTCDARHILTQFDCPHKSVPLSGDVRFQVLATHSPTHFTVRLLEHRSLERNKWQKMPHVDDYFSFENKFNEYFDDEANHEIHPTPLKLGDLCVIDDDEKLFYRCQILGIDLDSKQKKITLLLIDSNVTMECHDVNHLLVLPTRFREFPPQAVDIRIADVVPLDLDTTWDKSFRDSVKKWFKDNESCRIQAKIELNLMNCIWVKTVKLIDKLSSIDKEVMVLDIKKTIIKRGMGLTEEKSLKMLREMAQKTGILVTEPCTPQTDLLTLKKDQQRGRGRGKVLSNSSNESVGSAISLPHLNPSNVMNDVNSNSSNECLIPSKALQKKIPISSPEKKVSSTAERWATLAPDTFNEVDIGQFYSPARFYVLLASQFKSFKKLMQKISEFTYDSSNLKPLANVEVGQVCLAYATAINDYGRAKIVRVDQTTVNTFLVDYGEELCNVPVKDLVEIPQDLIKRLPFQAILCNMVGIRPTNEYQEWPEEACQKIYQILNQRNSSLFVQSTGRHSVTNDVIRCHSYDAIYVNKALKQNVNQLVVKKGFADFDAETQHFTDLIFDWNSLSTYNADDSDWDSDECENANVFDAGRYMNRTVDERKSASLNSSDDESDKEFDLQISEDQLKEWANLPKDSKFFTADNQPVFPSAKAIEEVKKAEEKPSVKFEQITQTTAKNCGTPFAGVNEKLVNCIGNQLVHPAKIPNIVWKQTASMITITIEAPDVKDYSLKVGSRYVHFSFTVNKERFENILNLFGCVDAKSTSHEVRGLNLIVRLKKTLATIDWPRLVQSPDKNRFIKYKIDEYDDSDEKCEIGHVRKIHKVDSNSEQDNDDELDLSDDDL